MGQFGGMRSAFAAILAVHGLIHLMGPAKAFGLAELPQLHGSISRSLGLAWLLAALLMIATAVTVIVWPREWWMLGAVALVVSQLVIVTSWSDAKVGTVPNAILLVGLVLSILSERRAA